MTKYYDNVENLAYLKDISQYMFKNILCILH